MNWDANHVPQDNPSTQAKSLLWILLVPLSFLLIAGATLLILNLSSGTEETLGEPTDITVLSPMYVRSGEALDVLVHVTAPNGDSIQQIPVSLQLDIGESVQALTDQRGHVLFVLPPDMDVGEHNLILTVPEWGRYRASGLRSTLTVASLVEEVEHSSLSQTETVHNTDSSDEATNTDNKVSAEAGYDLESHSGEEHHPETARDAHAESEDSISSDEHNEIESEIVVVDVLPQSDVNETPIAIPTHAHWIRSAEGETLETDIEPRTSVEGLRAQSVFIWGTDEKPDIPLEHGHEIVVATSIPAVTTVDDEAESVQAANTVQDTHAAQENHDEKSGLSSFGEQSTESRSNSLQELANTDTNVPDLSLPSLSQDGLFDGEAGSESRWIDMLLGFILGAVAIVGIYLFAQSSIYNLIKEHLRTWLTTARSFFAQAQNLRRKQAAQATDGEEVAQPKTSERLQKLLLGYLGTVKWSLAAAGGAMLAFTVVELLAPWPLKIIIDYVLLEEPLPVSWGWLNRLMLNNKIAVLFGTAGILVVITLLTSIFSYIQVYLTSHIGYRLVYTLRTELFDHLQRLSLSFHNHTRRGELLTKVSSDTSTLKDLVAETGLDLVLLVMKTVGMFTVMFWLNWRLALIVMVTFPILLVVFNYLRKHLKESVRRQRKNEGRIASQLTDMLTAIPLVQAFGREEHELDQFRHESARSMDEGVRVARLDATVSQAIAIINTLGISTVMIFGAWQALSGNMTAGALLVFITYTRSLYKPISKLVKLFAKLTKASVSINRIGEILAVEPAMQDKPNALQAHKLHGDIRFENVSFGYDRKAETLQNVSFDIKAGQRIALVGSSGAGKSTIATLLLRLYDPDIGTITIDGIDLRDYQRRSLRNEIGLVLQESILFGTSIADNIRYGHPEASLREIEAAARQAHIHDFVWSLPDQYDTVIGEMGSTLSGGQKQRIAIARALVKKPSILVLDEPTSALDPESRGLIQQTLDQMRWGKTVILIAHDLSSVRNFDQILVMEEGRLVEQGTHQELMARQGVYRGLVQIEGGDAQPESMDGQQPSIIKLPRRDSLSTVTG